MKMKSLSRFTKLVFMAALFVAPAGGALAQAQAYPGKPIHVIVPFPPGGSTDFLARIVGQKLTAAWGQPVIIDNRPGAGGTMGAAEAARTAPDGYTLLLAGINLTIATSVYAKLPYDFQKDFAPITMVAIVPNVLVVNPSIPAHSVKELIAYAKANPGKLTHGSGGMGTSHHLIGELFNAQAGVDILHVPYKGSAPAVADLIGGQISLMFDTVASCLPHIKAGKLRPLGVTTAKRSVSLPDVPTIAEAALPGFEVSTWFGFVAPAKTPAGIITKLNMEIVKILNMPDVKERLLASGSEPVGNTPEQMAAQIAKETAEFAKITKQAKLIAE
jgi:tripartite-type tricarboxylate transporter receptor subunit TctC